MARGLLSLFVGGSLLLSIARAFADIPSSPPFYYQYQLTLPTIVGGTPDYSQTFQYEFSNTGPLTYENPSGWLVCPIYCGPLGSPGAPDPTIYGNPYEDFNSINVGASGMDAVLTVEYGGFDCVGPCTFETITYTLTEPDSFWASLGQQTFDNASITVVDGSLTENSPCTQCVVSTATPEAGQWVPLVFLLSGLALTVRHRRRRAALPHR